jgi:hypothetical protein
VNGPVGAGQRVPVVPADQLVVVVGDERRRAAEQLVGDAAQGVEVGGRAQPAVAAEQLGRGVAEVVGQARQVPAGGRRRQRGVAEEDVVVAAEEDVGRHPSWWMMPPAWQQSRQTTTAPACSCSTQRVKSLKATPPARSPGSASWGSRKPSSRPSKGATSPCPAK